MHESLQKIVEAICNQGCIRVNEIIASMECGKAIAIAEAKHLHPHDASLLLQELKSIMSVYQKKS